MSLSFAIVTWNMGKSIKKINDWTDEISQWSIIDKSHDIIFITFQEASKHVGSKLIYEAIQTKLPDHDVIVNGEGSMIPTLNFWVFGYLCIKKSLSKKCTLIKQSVCITKWMMCTKPSVGFGINFGGTHFIFVGSHFPVNTSDKDTYGYVDRINAIHDIKTNLIDKIADQLGAKNPNIFWAGDMNFRIQSDDANTEQFNCFTSGCMGTNNNSTCEILNETIKYTDCESIRGFVEALRDSNYHKSCRYQEYNDDIDIVQFLNPRNYDAKRKQSYCDRIIYRGKINPGKYSSWPNTSDPKIYPLSIAYSDHEPVYLNGTIDMNTLIQSGGKSTNIYFKKYMKYKMKYIEAKKLKKLMH